MRTEQALAGPGRKIRQKRSRRTYNALIATGFKLLEKREFESITIAELAQAAGYSVGAFYSRFHSKDQFFEALIAHHLQERSRTREELLATAPTDDLIETLVEDLVRYYWKRRRFWRAALLRSAGDPEFWEPIGKHAHEFVVSLMARIQSDARHRLTETECKNIRFACQLVLGTINNRIVNRPHPTLTDRPVFVEDLARAFRLVADYDKLTGAGKIRAS